MLYIKGLFVGTITLVLSIVVYVVVWIYFMKRTYAAVIPPGTEVGFDVSVLFHSPLFWLVAALGFVCGFLWSLGRVPA